MKLKINFYKKHLFSIFLIQFAILTVVAIILLSSCTENVSPPDKIGTYFTVHVYDLCGVDTTILTNVEVKMYDSENESNCFEHTNNPFKTGITGIDGSIRFDFDIPITGRIVDVVAIVTYIDSIGGSQVVIRDSVCYKITICFPWFLNVYFECLIKGHLEIKRDYEPVDSLKACPHALQDTIYGSQIPPKVFVKYPFSSNDIATRRYNIYNPIPNPDILCFIENITPSGLDPYSGFDAVFINAEQVSSDGKTCVIPSNSSVVVEIVYTSLTFEQFLNHLNNKPDTTRSRLDSAMIGVFRVYSGNCYFTITDTAFLEALPVPSPYTCMLAYGQTTDLTSNADWELYSLSGGKKNLLIDFPGKIPQNPPSKDYNCDFYFSAPNYPPAQIPTLHLLIAKIHYTYCLVTFLIAHLQM